MSFQIKGLSPACEKGSPELNKKPRRLLSWASLFLAFFLGQDLFATREATPLLVPAPPYQMVGFERQGQTRIEIPVGQSFVIPQKGSLARYCIGEDQYFTRDGGLGQKGEILKRELLSLQGSKSTPMGYLFFRNQLPGFEQACPNYSHFSDSERLNFWVWYFASIALTESECGRNAYNPHDPHGVSVGELQIPESWGSRSWRGVNPQSGRRAGGCDAKESAVSPMSRNFHNAPKMLLAQVDNNLSCGVEILSGVLCGFYSSHSQICSDSVRPVYGHGFWKDLRVGLNGKIMKSVVQFPPCHEN